MDYGSVCDVLTSHVSLRYACCALSVYLCVDVCVCVCAVGEQIRKRRCKAAFSYVPQHEDELELKIGDVIEIIAEVRLITSSWTHHGGFHHKPERSFGKNKTPKATKHVCKHIYNLF